MVVTTACWYKVTYDSIDFYMKETPEIKWLTGVEKTNIAGIEGKRVEGVNTGHSKDITITLYNTNADNFATIVAKAELTVGVLASVSVAALLLTKMDGSGANWGPYNALPKDPSAILQTKDGGHYMNVTFEIYDTIPPLV